MIPEWVVFLGLGLFWMKFIWNLREKYGKDFGGLRDPHESTGTSGWGEG